MSLFFMLLKGAAKVMEDDELRKKISTGLTSTINGIDKFLEEDKGKDTNKKEFTFNDVTDAINDIQMLVSLLGLAASSDGVIHDKEEEAVDKIIEVIGFNGDEANNISPLFPKEYLEKFELKKKDLKKLLCDRFLKPYPLEEVVKYIISNEREEDAYTFACGIVGSDDNIADKEVEFLLNLSKMLELPILDRKRIEREQLGKALSTDNIKQETTD